ncbi:hypothetical protein J4475_02705 [Candidatus Woesearchaeota archaeon]|nr:hypothetical protein [Candidatus Woesearchaeota archaeon]
MKALVFDASPVISLTLNNLLWVLEPLRRKYEGKFLFGTEVKRELIDKPLTTKRFKYEALQVLNLIDIQKVVDDPKVDAREDRILELANNTFEAEGRYIKILHPGESQALGICREYDADALVIDERTTRDVIENPDHVRKLLTRKLHTNVKANAYNLKMLRKEVQGIKVIRSVELVMIAYELGIFDDMLKNISRDIENPRTTFLESVLWGLRIEGCSVADEEIKQLIRIGTKA